MQTPRYRLLAGAGVLAAAAAVALPLSLAPLGSTAGAGSTAPDTDATATTQQTAPPPWTLHSPIPGAPTTTTLPGTARAYVPIPAPPPPLVPHYEGPPTTAISSEVPCDGTGMTAKLDRSGGPVVGMGTDQEIVSITSSRACWVSGFPTIQFTNASGTVATSYALVDGGTLGRADPPSTVTVAPGQPISFLIEFDGHYGTCSAGAAMTFGPPAKPPVVPVSLNAVSMTWPVCPTIHVTPFEQGDSIDRYASYIEK